VVQHPGLFLSQHHNTPSTISKTLEHHPTPHSTGPITWDFGDPGAYFAC
jgi:hypothetical protein